MSRNIFGWDLPPGAAGDPNAPWNQSDEHCPCCPCNESAVMKCDNCGEEEGKGICWLWGTFPNRLAAWLGHFKALQGRFQDYCTVNYDPDCLCNKCNCYDNEKDYDPAEEYNRYGD